MDELKPMQPAPQSANDWGSRSNVHTSVLMAVTLFGVYICYLLAAPFLPAIVWALALAVLIAPLHRWFESKIKYPSLAASLSVLLAALFVVVPGIFVIERMIGEAAQGAETIKRMVETGEWMRVFEANPYIAPVGHWIEQQLDLPGMVKAASAWLSSSSASFVQGSILQLISLALTFYLLFYFLRDRGVFLESLQSLSPLSEEDMNLIFKNVVETINATLYGTLAVAVIQGALGGLMFWWLGLPAPLLWGIIMMLLSLVPVLGAFIIWIPAAIFMVLEGSAGKGMLLAIWGAIVVGGIDNLLYPIWVGKRLKIHTVLIFISLVGGIVIFGASGLILGPVIFTVTRLLLKVWSRQNAL